MLTETPELLYRRFILTSCGLSWLQSNLRGPPAIERDIIAPSRECLASYFLPDAAREILRDGHTPQLVCLYNCRVLDYTDFLSSDPPRPLAEILHAYYRRYVGRPPTRIIDPAGEPTTRARAYCNRLKALLSGYREVEALGTTEELLQNLADVGCRITVIDRPFEETRG